MTTAPIILASAAPPITPVKAEVAEPEPEPDIACCAVVVGTLIDLVGVA